MSIWRSSSVPWKKSVVVPADRELLAGLHGADVARPHRVGDPVDGERHAGRRLLADDVVPQAVGDGRAVLEVDLAGRAGEGAACLLLLLLLVDLDLVAALLHHVPVEVAVAGVERRVEVERERDVLRAGDEARRGGHGDARGGAVEAVRAIQGGWSLALTPSRSRVTFVDVPLFPKPDESITVFPLGLVEVPVCDRRGRRGARGMPRRGQAQSAPAQHVSCDPPRQLELTHPRS